MKLDNFKKHDSDTGSLEVQVALLTEKINNLNQHLKSYPKDFSSKRGILLLVGRRHRFLRYIEKHNHDKYKDILKLLGLRK